MAEKTKYQFNGQTYSVKGRLCHDIVKHFVDNNPNATLKDVQDAFNLSNVKVVVTPDVAMATTDSSGKAGGNYYMKEEDRIAIKKGEVVVWSYWPERYFEPFIEQVKALGMNVVIQEDKASADSKVATSESPLDKAIAKIKKSMKDNGLSVFYLFSGDYYFALEGIFEDVKKAMPKEELDGFDSEDVTDFLCYGQGEFSISFCKTMDGGSIKCVIRKIESKGDELLFTVDEVECYDGNYRLGLYENKTIDELKKIAPNPTEDFNVESAIVNIANNYIDEPFLIAASKVADFDLLDYCD